ncbi:MAG TPA: hypothetical protein VGM02_02145 [Acidobacteriaceae bacterium]|jgi:hypothetical protein
MTRVSRLLVVFDIAIVLLFALFLWAPWSWIDSGRIADATSSSITMVWLALPVTLARHGFHLEYATDVVTISALVAAALGALLSIAAQMRGSSALSAVGAFLFGSSVAILMPLWTAVGFLGALLLIVALRARFVRMLPTTALIAVLRELWAVGYAIGFAVLAWRYNPQLLIKTLVIALGVSLVARALVPSTSTAS